mgnify:CR=1 FL=1
MALLKVNLIVCLSAWNHSSTLIYPDCKSSRRSKCKKCFKYMLVILILRLKVQLGIKFNVQCGIKVFLEAKVTFSDCFGFLICSRLRLEKRTCPDLTTGKRLVSEI